MFYIIGFIGFIIALISPSIGALFIITALGKYFVEDSQRVFHFFIGWLLLCGSFYLLKQIDNIITLDLVIGTGLSCFLLFLMINKEYSHSIIFMILLLVNSSYIGLRQFFFHKEIAINYNHAVDEAIKLVNTRFQGNSEQSQIFQEMTELMRNFYLQYNPGIWIASLILCLMIGYFFFSRKRENLQKLADYQTSAYLIYTLIIAMCIALFTKYKLYAVNYVIALSPLYLMQGIGVANQKLGRWFLSSKVLIAVAILLLIINPYIVIFITTIGLFDCWFDFRKLNKIEDLNENNIN